MMLLGVLAAACVGCVQYDQRNGPGIAAHLRELQAPIVSEVRYSAGDYLHAASIVVVLKAGVAAEEAQTFICEVALPYAEASDPPAGLGIVAFGIAALESSRPTRLAGSTLRARWPRATSGTCKS